jgi:hypothetical protein
MKRRYYVIVSLPAGSRLCVEETMTVLAFATPTERRRYVDQPWEERRDEDRVLMTHGEDRRTATRREAAEAMRQILEGINGGRQSGYAALATLDAHPLPLRCEGCGKGGE